MVRVGVFWEFMAYEFFGLIAQRLFPGRVCQPEMPCFVQHAQQVLAHQEEFLQFFRFADQRFRYPFLRVEGLAELCHGMLQLEGHDLGMFAQVLVLLFRSS